MQLLGSPGIHKRCQVPTSSYYLEEVPEKLKVTTTNFTAHNNIGESSGIHLVDSPLPKLSESSLIYNQIEGSFSLKDGSPFSSNKELVPIVSPPTDIELPYKTIFKLCMLVQRGNLIRPTFDMNLFRLVDPWQREGKCIEDAQRSYFSQMTAIMNLLGGSMNSTLDIVLPKNFQTHNTSCW
ncbi:hypothetical protein Vadar_024814 [Vaccinium darrowii]|uniref:Uncharacterized protein n=1 Tax=Vaccinium darrowii TaxID=229202 RepID=A0ACB7XUJ0_9ERIC|nr:hypothetical protein Vadar_024814 [Vaccinium darrowii]